MTPDTPDAVLNLETQQDHLWQGTWKLKKTLEFGSVPIKIAYSYAIEHGTAMSVKDYREMYASGDAEEYTSVIIIETAGVLRMEVNFPTTPKRFPVSPKVRVIHLGADIALENLQHKFEHNEDLNRCILEMWNPPLDHEVRIAWALPEVWP